MKTNEYWLFEQLENHANARWYLAINVIDSIQDEDSVFHGNCICSNGRIDDLKRAWTPPQYNFSWYKNIEQCSERKINETEAFVYML